jgi:Zn ribbon nucleic-acid-binding protein
MNPNVTLYVLEGLWLLVLIGGFVASILTLRTVGKEAGKGDTRLPEPVEGRTLRPDFLDRLGSLGYASLIGGFLCLVTTGLLVTDLAIRGHAQPGLAILGVVYAILILCIATTVGMIFSVGRTCPDCERRDGIRMYIKSHFEIKEGTRTTSATWIEHYECKYCGFEWAERKRSFVNGGRLKKKIARENTSS